MKRRAFRTGIFRGISESFIMFKNHFARFALVGAAIGGMANHVFAADGITAALAAVDLSGVATAVGAVALVIVAIALVFKGPDIAKRVIRKV